MAAVKVAATLHLCLGLTVPPVRQYGVTALIYNRNTASTLTILLTNVVCPYILLINCLFLIRGRGNSTVVSVSVYQVGDPGSRPPQSARKGRVEFYHCVIDSLRPGPTTG